MVPSDSTNLLLVPLQVTSANFADKLLLGSPSSTNTATEEQAGFCSVLGTKSELVSISAAELLLLAAR